MEGSRAETGANNVFSQKDLGTSSESQPLSHPEKPNQGDLETEEGVRNITKYEIVGADPVDYEDVIKRVNEDLQEKLRASNPLMKKLPWETEIDNYDPERPLEDQLIEQHGERYGKIIYRDYLNGTEFIKGVDAEADNRYEHDRVTHNICSRLIPKLYIDFGLQYSGGQHGRESLSNIEMIEIKRIIEEITTFYIEQMKLHRASVEKNQDLKRQLETAEIGQDEYEKRRYRGNAELSTAPQEAYFAWLNNLGFDYREVYMKMNDLVIDHTDRKIYIVPAYSHGPIINSESEESIKLMAELRKQKHDFDGVTIPSAELAREVHERREWFSHNREY